MKKLSLLLVFIGLFSTYSFSGEDTSSENCVYDDHRVFTEETATSSSDETSEGQSASDV